jgi:hypothetical protein
MTSSAAIRYAALGLLALCAFPTQAMARSCRAQAIMTSQCAWFALEELGGSKQAAAQAQDEATSGLIAGCSQGEYQLVLLRGTGLTQAVIERLRASGTRETAAVRAACAAEAGRMAVR